MIDQERVHLLILAVFLYGHPLMKLSQESFAAERQGYELRSGIEVE